MQPRFGGLKLSVDFDDTFEKRVTDWSLLRLYPIAWRKLFADGIRRFHRSHWFATGHRFKDGFLEQLARLLAQHEQRDRGYPRRRAEQGDVTRITPNALMFS